MKIIKQTYLIKAPIEKVWQAFVDPEIINKWGAGPAVMSEEEGFKFSLWGGDIHGTNTKVVKEKKLVQDWYGGDWAKPSKVTFTFFKDKGNAKVELLQENVPDEEFESINQGWKDYYLGPIKNLFEKAD